MSYTKEQFEDAVAEFGEIFFVLDSGEEYEIHGTRSYELEDGIIEIEGIQGDEYVIVQFPLDAIEHHYSHKEV